MSMNKCLMTQLNECEVIVQTNNDFLDDLFYTDEPVTKDDYVSFLTIKYQLLKMKTDCDIFKTK